MALLRCALLQLLAASLLVNTSPDSIQLDFPHLERGMVRLCPGGLEARQGINRVAGQDFVEGGSSRLLAALRSGLSGPQLHVVRGGGEDDMDDGEQPGGGGGGAGQKRGMQKRGMRLRTGAKHAAKRACLTTPMEEGGDGSSESESLDAEAEPQMGPTPVEPKH
ncbi:hypothetical protein T484DRAFT_1844757 [Baffinella frigidus]|nr:hypothetical protein T484DRAFT_1844757 [Cryptophyta sp. CCMP2293]